MRKVLKSATLGSVLSVGLLATAPGYSAAAEWRYYAGVHDFVTPEMDAHAYGVSGGAAVDGLVLSGRHYSGSFDIFWDRDKDHLDSDHIPIWWQVHLETDGELWQASPRMRVNWIAEVDTRMNTASSIERQIKVLPALVAGYYGDAIETSLKGGLGWFFLEIDDDAPKEIGYDPDELRNTTLAGALSAEAAFKFGPACKLTVQGQQWWDSDQWLQSQYAAALQIALGNSKRAEQLVVSGEFNEYNLDPYRVASLPPVLAWDHDVLFRVFVELTW